MTRSSPPKLRALSNRLFLGAALLALACPLTGLAATAGFGDSGVKVAWQTDNGHMRDVQLITGAAANTVSITAPFAVTFSDGRTLSTSDFLLTSPPESVDLPADPASPRLSDQTARKRIRAVFTDPDGRLRIDWSLEQSPGEPYLRERVTLTALKQDEALSNVTLLAATIPGAEVTGRVAGSPVMAGNTFMVFENPLSKSDADLYSGRVRMWIDRSLPLLKGQSVSYSAVAGVTEAGQLRRGFLHYLERERAHPYRTFLHYNSWYDIGYTNAYTEAQAVDRINAFGAELTVKRGVKLDSFLFDDGWDDLSGSWKFSKDFPNGFKPLSVAAAKFGAEPGVWLSPWGGYANAKLQRVNTGKSRGYEIIDGGLALSGPRYYDDFHKATLDLLTNQGVNQFKFDGTGNANSVFPGSRFDSDFDAAIHLIDDLRHAKPNLFINLTTGTYPSPSWLFYADSIWRGGQDHAFTGVGTPRERWMTYRDRETYEGIVVGGPLFPLNALMLHGIIYAQHAPGLDSDPGNDFAQEVHSYFGSGTGLQELYITPALLTPQNWDTLAAAAKWSRDNADVLKDTHWIGGDPGRLQVYGWGAWAPHKAFVTLRNPDSRPQTFVLDVATALELPAGAARAYKVNDLWNIDPAGTPREVSVDQPPHIRLKPFEVITLELVPAR